MVGILALIYLLCAPTAEAMLLSSNHTHRWKPEPCGELEPGVPCRVLYKYPQGSGFVEPCPVDTYTSTDGCAAQFKGKSDVEMYPQLVCGEALGTKFKLVCSGPAALFAGHRTTCSLWTG